MNTVVSDAARQRFINDKVFPPEKTLTVYNCINIDHFCIIDRQGRKRFRWITVGRLVKIKNQLLILQAMMQLPHSELIIVGEGEETAYIANIYRSKFSQRASYSLGKKG